MDFKKTTKTFVIKNEKLERLVKPNYYVEYEYSGNRERSTVYDEWGSDPEWTEEEYDSYGNLVHRENDGGFINTYEYKYDGKGKLLYSKADTTIKGRHILTTKTWFEYDAEGKLIHFKNSDGDEYWSKYDDNGHLIYDRFADGEEKWYENDENGNVIYEKSSEGYEYWREYNSKGKMIKEENNHNKVCFYEYDDEGKLLYEYEKNKNKWERFTEYTYDANGKLKTEEHFTAE